MSLSCIAPHFPFSFLSFSDFLILPGFIDFTSDEVVSMRVWRDTMRVPKGMEGLVGARGDCCTSPWHLRKDIPGCFRRRGLFGTPRADKRTTWQCQHTGCSWQSHFLSHQPYYSEPNSLCQTSFYNHSFLQKQSCFRPLWNCLHHFFSFASAMLFLPDVVTHWLLPHPCVYICVWSAAHPALSADDRES